jgi:hypothetical protein
MISGGSVQKLERDVKVVFGKPLLTKGAAGVIPSLVPSPGRKTIVNAGTKRNLGILPKL